ncbi:MAG: glycosyltransferase family 39 protein [Anaerolineales bacterium]|nr:glycosyltransferase family 39 protein [Anaerolineales bacterium]
MRHRSLWMAVLLLLMQFWLRAHHPTQLPFFWDENRHMVRADAITDGGHPAENSHGKFLLYAWLAPFHVDTERDAALHISRSAVALFSLLGAATLFTLTRRLFGTAAGYAALAFYALAPFAMFYERMVLSDGLAAALGVLTAWHSIRLAERPTYRRGVWVGVFAALAVMAKLTMTFSTVLMPVLAGFLLGSHPILQPQTWREWLIARWKRYWWYWVAAGVAFVVMWLPTLIPALIEGQSGHYYVLVDQSLVDTSVFSANDGNRYTEFLNQFTTMLSLPMVVVLLVAIGLGLWKLPRPTLFGLAWLLLIWVPNLLMVWRTQTRYLMPGVYALAFLLAIGTAAARGLPALHHRPRLVNLGIATILILWGVGFALPFASTAANDAAMLNVPRWDARDYYQAPWNAYGLLPALHYLDEQGQADAKGQVHVVGVAWMCEFMDLYHYEHIDLTCTTGKDYDSTPNGTMWQEIIEASHHQPMYLMLEQNRKTLEIPEIPFTNSNLVWERIAAFQRPKGGLWVTVWRVQRFPSIG